MKITIEMDDGDTTVFSHVAEFALVATDIPTVSCPVAVNISHGNSFVLVGRLEEMKERLRQHHASPDR